MFLQLFFEWEAHMTGAAKERLGDLWLGIRNNRSYKECVDGNEWRRFLMEYESYLLEAMKLCPDVVDAQLCEYTFTCLRTIYICISTPADQLDDAVRLQLKAACLAYGTTVTTLCENGYFDPNRCCNLYVHTHSHKPHYVRYMNLYIYI